MWEKAGLFMRREKVKIYAWMTCRKRIIKRGMLVEGHICKQTRKKKEYEYQQFDGNRRLWFHWQQLYPLCAGRNRVHGQNNQRRQAYICGESRKSQRYRCAISRQVYLSEGGYL